MKLSLAVLTLALTAAPAFAAKNRKPASSDWAKGKAEAIRLTDKATKKKFVRAQIEGAAAEKIYGFLTIEENTAKGPGGGQQQKVADDFTCVNDPADGYSCTLDFGEQGIASPGPAAFGKRVKSSSRAAVMTDSSDESKKFVRAEIEGGAAKVIYDLLKIEENIAKGPGGGQAQKVGDHFTCVNDPADGYSCVLDFNEKGLEP